MQKELTIIIPTSYLADRLKEAFDKGGTAYSRVVTEVIIENLTTTEKGLSQLLLAFSGHKEKIIFYPGDEVKIHSKDIYSWTANRDAMKAAGLVDDSDNIKAIIVRSDLTKRDSVCVEFERVVNPGDTVTKVSQWFNPDKLIVTPDCKIVRTDIADKL